MTRSQIVKAWKNPAYRNSLSADERSSLPENPAGLVELSDAELQNISGAFPLPETVNPMRCTLATRNCDSVCVVFSC